MKHYVKVENGVIVEGPKEISSSQSASPNIYWSKEQMKLNGFFQVDLTHDQDMEILDLTNPIITSDGVSFPIVDKPASEALECVKTTLLREKKKEAYEIIFKKYSVSDISLAALGIIPSSDMKLEIQVVLDTYKQYKTEVNNSTTCEEAKSVKITWPTI